ncbi:LRR receptor-like serine/threonine-protein kinase GSO1 [Rhynchospora pubera]|uniref:LRR receptor-like serine/threonine-protein kinase GSO1 n=1 Tax=Rhynchospora pubera TaxID=906938 RepID=A0AAV8E772_9POAL|nr:LRR receptor-like serine/threonine-protein kinase GSO1 [Rhynchospora pubera]
MKLFHTVLLSFLVTITSHIISNGCFEVERDALLTLKAGLSDPGNLLSSWHGQDCCNWSGVICDDIASHVVKLSLRNPHDCVGYYCSDWESHALSGVIPRELANLTRLQFLDLSHSQFTGMLPPQLGNLSDLKYLSLMASYSYPSYKSISDNLSWLSRLSNLRYLDMSAIELNIRIDWSAINKMHLLETLILSHCYLSEIPTDLAYVNLTSLRKLDLSVNAFNTTLPNWLWNLTSLLYLDLGFSNFHGSVPSTLRNLASLNYLSLAANNFKNVFLESMSKLLHLRYSDLGYLRIGGDIKFIKSLGNIWYNLEFIILEGNDYSGNISIIHQLNHNSLSTNITREIGTHSRLKVLDLSENNLSGVITEAHFVNLSNLKALSLSGNYMLILKIKDKWVPPFQLSSLGLESCMVGPKFPMWLRWQKRLLNVQLSNTSITGTIPNWFWNMPLQVIDLSYNNITGSLPVSFQLSKIVLLDLSNNSISGPFPTKLEFPLALFIALSGNRIHGTIPQSICDMKDLGILDLSDNAIMGELPNCWKSISTLESIDLSNNQITGELPTSIGSLQYLTTLQLYNNKFYGEIPSSFIWCQSLVLLSLGANNFSGTIPAWIGKQLKNLAVLQLRLNNFTGYIPSELGELTKLQILDLAHNSLVGSIPSSFGNFSSMKNSSEFYSNDYGDVYKDILYIDINGQYMYTSMPLAYAKTIDISGNNLKGQIPEEIWLLQALINLNFSKNCLIGEIPQTIGIMQSLENLDLSFNELSGLIPQALSTLSSLHNLNLSYNNFSGNIPTGRQLDTISDPSIYIGNSYLCGSPTNKNCSKDQTSLSIESATNQSEILWFYWAIALGFFMGFWSVCVILIFRIDWSVAYFQIIDNLFDKMYIQIVLAMRRLGE